MKNVKLLDTLPTPLGLVTIGGMLLYRMSRPIGNNTASVLALVILGGTLITLVISVISVTGAIARHKFRSFHAVNLVWALAGGGFLAMLNLSLNHMFGR
jgi:hypothetical protein